MLEDEHDDMRAMLAHLLKAHGQAARHQFDEFSELLRLHEELEQAYFYPQLRQDEAARDIALESYEEHHLMDVLVDELAGLRPDDEQWMPKIRVLNELADHHMEQEEHTLFPRVRAIWDDDKRRHVGRHMEQLKARRRREVA